MRQSLADAASGETINIPPGTYALTSGQLVVDVEVTLRSTLGAGVTTIQSTGSFRALCISAAAPVTIDGITITGGRAAPSGGACSDGQGGGIHSAASTLEVSNSVVQGNSANPTGSGGGGGIFAAGDLFVRDSVVRNNSTTALSQFGGNGGGGIYWAGSGFPSFEVTDSTVSGNTATVAGDLSGGGGIYSSLERPTLANVTVSGNSHRVAAGALSTGGGGGLFSRTTPSGLIQHTTFFGNASDRSGGAIAGPGTMILRDSVLHGNTAPANPDCAAGAVTSQDGNVKSIDGSECGFGADDLAGVDPQLGALALNGSDNGTLTHELLSRQSPAVEFGVTCSEPQDQRGVGRFENCDSGAYEFDGRASATVPNCSPTGVIPLALDEPPGGDVIGLTYRVNGGGAITQDTGDSGEAPTPISVALVEGRNTLEYWGRWTNGVEQGHGFTNVLVDKTKPNVSVANDQPRAIFVIARRATASVAAADALSGLVQNPTASGVPLATGRRGAATFSSTASDLCANPATGSLDYRVLAPGLGFRTVLERTRGKVRVRRPSSGATARISQKGQPFSALTEPRELPVASFIDTRAGTARLTTARTRREDQIQAGRFAAGVFQVLQSRRLREKGLTEVRLKGGSFKRCAPRRKGRPGASALPRRVIRRLRGNSTGRFRTRGRHSAATVRGTAWEVIDRCDGTLTRVKRGKVSVRDFVRKRTVTVRAGRSYLARAPRR